MTQAKAETFLTQTHVRFLKLQREKRAESHHRSTHPSPLTRQGGPAEKPPSRLVLSGVPGTIRPRSTDTHTVIAVWSQTVPLKITPREWESSDRHWKRGDEAQEQAWGLHSGPRPLAAGHVWFVFRKQKLGAVACKQQHQQPASSSSFRWSSQADRSQTSLVFLPPTQTARSPKGTPTLAQHTAPPVGSTRAGPGVPAGAGFLSPRSPQHPCNTAPLKSAGMPADEGLARSLGVQIVIWLSAASLAAVLETPGSEKPEAPHNNSHPNNLAKPSCGLGDPSSRRLQTPCSRQEQSQPVATRQSWYLPSQRWRWMVSFSHPPDV